MSENIRAILAKWASAADLTPGELVCLEEFFHLMAEGSGMLGERYAFFHAALRGDLRAVQRVARSLADGNIFHA